GNPDMRGPIGYAMGYPERIPYGAKPLDLPALGHLDFAAPDFDRFPCLRMAIEALKAAGSSPIVLNGANEAAVAAFLGERIPFGRISEVIDSALQAVPQRAISCIEDVHAVDLEAREAAAQTIRRFS
ncbi:MAG: 1-deoxy-D-xylulose-5-phosphate reductoisomerase, partial [Clostridia bacterium]|nr:1-deoxy-D-xylulose-5-phosphate reductoisomerase [Clostridia bacterium]